MERRTGEDEQRWNAKENNAENDPVVAASMAGDEPYAAFQGNQKPNARGKPRRSAKHVGHPQVKLVGVGLTDQLGSCTEWKAA